MRRRRMMAATGLAALLAGPLSVGLPASANAVVAPVSAPAGVAVPAGAKAQFVRSLRLSVVQLATTKLGSAYQWGGAGPDAFDCSGFVLWVYQNALGTELPHYSGAQMDVTMPVARDKLRKGDLLFYGAEGSQHVSIYIGKGLQIAANNPRVGVVIDSIDSGYWADRFVGAGRVIRL